MKNKGLIIKIIISVLVILFLLFAGKSIFNKFNRNTQIQGIRRASYSDYDNVYCTEYNCEALAAIKADRKEITIFNVAGDKAFKYINKNDEIPKNVTDTYYISYSNKKNEYYVRNRGNKLLFKSTNTLTKLTDDYLIMYNGVNYSIIDTTGKEIYKNVLSYKKYDDIYEIKSNENVYILNKKLEKLLVNYNISKVYKDEYDILYLIVQNIENKNYYYYNVAKEKIIGNPFKSYIEKKNNIIIKDKNNIEYILSETGKQVRITLDKKVVKNISRNYNIYNESIYNEKQKYILVDSKKENAIGILDIGKNKFYKLYSYKKIKNIKSEISALNADNLTLKISCSYACDENKTVIYDMEDNRELFRKNSQIYSYMQFSDNHKIVKLSGNLYVVYDKNNKKIFKSEKKLFIANKKILIGDIPYSDIYLYSISKNKIINDKPLIINQINDNILYKNINDKRVTYINENGDVVIDINTSNYIKLIDNYYIYINDNNYLNVYDINKDKTYSYKFKKGESIKNMYDYIINPYNNAIFISNNDEQYIKIMNFKFDLFTKINDAKLYQVKINDKNGNAYMIVKNKDKYNIYIAK